MKSGDSEKSTTDVATSMPQMAFEAYRESLRKHRDANGLPEYVVPVEWRLLSPEKQAAWMEVVYEIRFRT